MFASSRRRTALTVAAIVSLAVAVRAVYVLEQRANPLFLAPDMDARYHLEWARALLGGREFQPGPFFRAPLYPWTLAGLLKLAGGDLLAVRLGQCLFGGATTLLTWLTARAAYDRPRAHLAALLVALNWVLVYFDGELLIPTLAIPLDLLALWLSVRLFARPSGRRALAAGLAFGVAALARPNVLLVPPALALALLLRRRRSRPASEEPAPARARLALAALLGLATLLPIVPVTAYNLLAGGDFVLISSQAGVNLWIGNNPASDGSTAIAPGTRGDWWGGYEDTIAQAEAAEGRPLRPSEVSRFYTEKALRFLFSPAGLAHLGWKLRLLWIDEELGNNADPEFFAHRYSRLVHWLPPSFGLLAPLGLVGLALALRRGRRTLPLVGFVLLYSASIVLFFVCSRYRAPLLPPLAIFSADTLLSGLAALRARRLRPLAAGAAAALGLAVFAQLVPAAVDRSDAAGLYTLGVRALAEGRVSDAIDLQGRAVDENPRFWPARKELGIALTRAGRPAEAVEHLREAVRLRPDDVLSWTALAAALVELGEGPGAERAARRALALREAHAPAWYNLARALLLQGRGGEARGAAERGLSADPGHFGCAFLLGRLAAAGGEPAVAAEAYARALASPEPPEGPWVHEAWVGRIEALLAAGERALAREALARARALFPASERLAALAARLP